MTRNTKDVGGTGAVVFNPWDDDATAFVLTEGSDTLKPTVYG